MSKKQKRGLFAIPYVASLVVVALGSVAVAGVVVGWTTFQKRLYAGLKAPSCGGKSCSKTLTASSTSSASSATIPDQKSEKAVAWWWQP